MVIAIICFVGSLFGFVWFVVKHIQKIKEIRKSPYGEKEDWTQSSELVMAIIFFCIAVYWAFIIF